jgi:hypothetical protein
MYTRIRKIDVREIVQRTARDSANVVPALKRIIKKIFHSRPGTDDIGDSIVSEIDEAYLRVFQIDARSETLGLVEALPLRRGSSQRIVAAKAIVEDHQVNVSVTICIDQLRSRVLEANSRRDRRQRTACIQAARPAPRLRQYCALPSRERKSGSPFPSISASS